MAEKKSLPVSDIMGLVAQHVIQAETFAARESLRYLQEFGFTGAGKDKDDLGELRYVQFSYPGRNVDGKMEKRLFRIPLLSLMQVPIIAIDDTEIEFAVRIDKVESDKQNGDVFYGMIDTMDSPATPAKGGEVPKMKVKMKLKPSDIPAGVSLMLRKFADGSFEEK